MKLFDELYGDIQADLVKQLSGTESGIVKAYRVALESIQQELGSLYRKYSKDGRLYWSEMNKYKRLQTLEGSIRKEFGKQLRGVDAYIEKQTIANFEDSFYRHAWAIDQDAGFAFSWGGVPTEAVEAIVDSPLSKLADSPALAAARAGAVNRVRNEITLSLVRGESYDKMSRRIGMVLGFDENNRFVGRGEAYRSMRIARTEGNRAMVQGQVRTYEKARANEITVEEYWDAALDDRTRPAHGRMDGKKRGPDGMFDTPVGKISAPLTSGVPAFDINCRCRIRGQIPGYPPETQYVRGEGSVPWISYEDWKNGLNQRGKASGPPPKKPPAPKKPKTYKPAGKPVSEALDVRTRKFKSQAEYAIAAVTRVHGDGKLPRIPIQASNAKTYYGAYDPQEGGLKIKLAGGDHVELTTIHEIGHFLDHKGFPGAGLNSEKLKPLIEEIRKTPEVQRLKKLLSDANTSAQTAKYVRYLLRPVELFARGYSQYIPTKIGDKKMLDQVQAIIENGLTESTRLSQWGTENFAPIEKSFDSIFEEMGWLESI